MEVVEVTGLEVMMVQMLMKVILMRAMPNQMMVLMPMAQVTVIRVIRVMLVTMRMKHVQVNTQAKVVMTIGDDVVVHPGGVRIDAASLTLGERAKLYKP